MIQVSDEVFERLVEAAVAAIPPRFADALDNVAFMVAPVPSPEQLAIDGGARAGTLLLGLYEGIPLPERDGGYMFVTPDVITVFKQSHEQVATSLEQLAHDVHQTVWHEVAHYFGLDHGQIEALERRDS